VKGKKTRKENGKKDRRDDDKLYLVLSEKRQMTWSGKGEKILKKELQPAECG